MRLTGKTPVTNTPFPLGVRRNRDRDGEKDRQVLQQNRRGSPVSTTSHSGEFTGWGMTMEKEGECLPYSL